MRVKGRLLAVLAISFAGAYFAAGSYLFPTDHQRVFERAQAARAVSEPFDVGVLWTRKPYNGFLIGCQLGVEVANAAGGRQLRLVPLEIGVDSLDAERAKIENMLISHPAMTTILCAPPESLVMSAEVIAESYGVAMLVTNLENPLPQARGLSYTIKMNPPYEVYARSLFMALPRVVTSKDPDLLRVGIFFNGSVRRSSTCVSLLMEECQTLNTSVTFVQELRREVAAQNIPKDLPVKQLRDDLAFQAGITRQASVVNDFLFDYASNAEIEGDLPLSVAMRRASGLRKKIEVAFVQAYLPDQQDYRPVLSALTLNNLDAVILASDLEGTGNLIAQLRGTEYRGPVFAMDYQRPETVVELYGENAGDFYLMASHTPNVVMEKFPQLGERFQQLAAESGQPGAFGEFGQLGFESVQLLSQVLASDRKTTSPTPSEIVNSLKYSSIDFEPLGDDFRFDRDGNPVNRDLFLMKLENGHLRKIELIEEKAEF